MANGAKINVPKFVKWYINGWQGCEGDVLSALNQLRADPDFIWLQGALMELLSRATNTARCYQGHILTAAHEPATASDVGRILRTKGRGSTSPKRQTRKKPEASTSPRQKKMTRKKPKTSTSSRCKKQLGKVNASGRSPPGRKQQKQAKKADSEGEKSPPFLKGKNKSKVAAQQKKNRSAPGTVQARKVMLNQQVKQMQSQGAATSTATANRGLAPTTAPSTSSTKSDESGRVRATGRIPAPSSSTPTIGEVIKLSAHRYDGVAWEFADDVLVRAGYFTSWHVDRVRSGGGRFTPAQENERAHWAKAWHNAKGMFGGESLIWLRSRIFKRADNLNRVRGTKDNPQSYLMTSWNNLVKDIKRKRKTPSGAG